MICISFNIRGLGAGPKFRALKHFFLNNKADIYFIQETMERSFKACEFFLKFLRDWKYYATDSMGLSGGMDVFLEP